MSKRTIDTIFWNDDKVIENFTIDDKYFWLYLLTNPNIGCNGVMNIMLGTMSRDLGYNKEVITNLILRFETYHKLITIDHDTGELFINNWGKYNWNSSPKIIAAVKNKCEYVVSEKIKNKVFESLRLFEQQEEKNTEIYPMDTLSIPYPYPILQKEKENKENTFPPITPLLKENKEKEKVYLVVSDETCEQQCLFDDEKTYTTVSADTINKENEQTATPVLITAQLNENEQEIFDAWNACGIITHRKPTKDIVKAIKRALSLYSVEDIKQAIQRYKTVYSDKKYFFEYKWNIITFLKQKNALPEFMDEGSKWNNYVAETSKNQPAPKKAVTINFAEADDYE